MTAFRTTRWSLVMESRGESRDAASALEALCRIYRPAVMSFVRRRGYAGADAEDLTQAFFENILRLKTHAAADPARGRFRVFLKVALTRFLSKHAVATHALKRGGGKQFESIDDDDAIDVAAGEPEPDVAFDRDFANAVIQHAMQALEDEARDADKLALFTALKPLLFDATDAGDQAAIAERLGLRRNTVAVALHRLRNRLREKVRDQLADTVTDAASLAGELDALGQSLGMAPASTAATPG